MMKSALQRKRRPPLLRCIHTRAARNNNRISGNHSHHTAHPSTQPKCSSHGHPLLQTHSYTWDNRTPRRNSASRLSPLTWLNILFGSSWLFSYVYKNNSAMHLLIYLKITNFLPISANKGVFLQVPYRISGRRMLRLPTIPATVLALCRMEKGHP